MNSSLQTTALSASAAVRSFEAQWRSRQRDGLAMVREQAMHKFLALGLPTSRDETWRYTNLRQLASQSFVDAPLRARGDVELNASLSLIGDAERAATVLLTNGHPAIRTTDLTLDGIEIRTLNEATKIDPKRMARLLEPASEADQRRFTLLNTALFVDGLHIKITGQVTTPLLVLHVASGNPEATDIAYPRILIEAAPGSKAVIIEHHVAHGEHTPLINSNTQILLGSDSQLEHYRVFATGASATHIDTLDLHQKRGSHCKQFTIALGGGLVRAALEAHLDEPDASLDCHSLLVGHQDRHVDCVNIVAHNAPRTRSGQTARAIASDDSRVIFNSKVIVNKGAIGTNSQQSFRGLLLSPNAEIDSRPQLEIHADEVKCAHGATTGRLDPDMLFYLLSRGIDRETAQSLLVYAFLADVLTGMSVGSARAAIETALISQLPDPQLLQKFR